MMNEQIIDGSVALIESPATTEAVTAQKPLVGTISHNPTPISWLKWGAWIVAGIIFLCSVSFLVGGGLDNLAGSDIPINRSGADGSCVTSVYHVPGSYLGDRTGDEALALYLQQNRGAQPDYSSPCVVL